ncbi:Bodo-specific multi-copy gene family, putative [Bodo saltans]|uniref:Bodo-specific multi-copy gene family, putative n=1 Tax=Bodo saltans TaxID=75058 RepID=A0A0S4IN15_BODSA|nr:Bodo-specific multi-copy gene family, putative [Bodo saltans]|eukprot:CUE77793.1 Bodo-specific multi-copy gene family, putative [Bodo saltans]
MGCNAKIEQGVMEATLGHIWNIGPLQPLSDEGHQEAIETSWKVPFDPNVRETVHQLAGGLPRLLRAAHEFPKAVCLAHGSYNALPACFEAYKEYAKKNYPIQGTCVSLAHTCMLASSTKATVRGNDAISLNPAWVEERKGTARRGKGPRKVDVDRVRLFEKPFLYAVYARYLLVLWKGTNKAPWVSLEKVFAGAIHPEQQHILKQYEVNLSGGLVTNIHQGSYENAAKRALSYVGASYHRRRVYLVPVKRQQGRGC